MRILFDQGTPAPLRRHLHDHFAHTAAEMGWSDLDNGYLLDEAEREDSQALITTDQNMRYQRNLGERQLAIIVLLSTAWPKMQLRIAEIRAALDEIRPGQLKEVPI